jgi:hypothetical protein
VFSPTDYFNKNPNVVLRRFPEWRQCFAYTPAHPELYELNATAWLIVELCEGHSLLELERAFFEIVRNKSTPDEANTYLRNGLHELIQRGILIHQSSPPRPTTNMEKTYHE